MKQICRYYTVEWVLGNVVCKIFKFMQMFSLYLSTFIMALIACHHFTCKCILWALSVYKMC